MSSSTPPSPPAAMADDPIASQMKIIAAMTFEQVPHLGRKREFKKLNAEVDELRQAAASEERKIVELEEKNAAGMAAGKEYQDYLAELLDVYESAGEKSELTETIEKLEGLVMTLKEKTATDMAAANDYHDKLAEILAAYESAGVKSDATGAIEKVEGLVVMLKARRELANNPEFQEPLISSIRHLNDSLKGMEYPVFFETGETNDWEEMNKFRVAAQSLQDRVIKKSEELEREKEMRSSEAEKQQETSAHLTIQPGVAQHDDAQLQDSPHQTIARLSIRANDKGLPPPQDARSHTDSQEATLAQSRADERPSAPTLGGQ